MSRQTRSPRVAVIQPRLAGFGGLEKYGAHVIDTLAERMPVTVVSEHVVDPRAVASAFGLDLQKAKFVVDPRCNPATPSGGRLAVARQRHAAWKGYVAVTEPYDLIIAQTVSLPWQSRARSSVLLCHFPVVKNLVVDPSVATGSLRSRFTSRGREQREIVDRLGSWSRIIANSEFTRTWVGRYWRRDADIINPPIELPPAPDLADKRNWILGVGFFSPPSGEDRDQWGYKRQEVLIDSFKRLCDQGLTGWEMHLAGHSLQTPEVEEYLRTLRARAGSYPIQLHPNCGHATLRDLYRHASVFWHATGFGIDPEHRPERMEHFGMVTAEAMGWGCVPVVVNRGGQPEIVEPGVSGYVWETLDELCQQTLEVAANPERRRQTARHAIERAQKYGLARFRKQLNCLVDEELDRLRFAVA